MPIEILMPALSPTMTEGSLAKWLKKEGDEVRSGDVLAEIETDKATMEVEAADDGRLGRILVPEGTEGVKVNQPIAVLLAEGEDASAVAEPAKSPQASPDARTASPNTPAPPAQRPHPDSSRRHSAPRQPAPGPACPSAFLPAASSGIGGLRGRPSAARFLDWAHQPDVVAVGIGDDRIPGTPEGVKRRLAARVASRGQLGIPLVDRIPGGQRESDDDVHACGISAPGGVPQPCRLGGVEL